MPNSRTKAWQPVYFFPVKKPWRHLRKLQPKSYTFLHKHILKKINPQRMAGIWLLASGICCFQKSCFITLQLSKLCKFPENREHKKHISNSNCWPAYLNLCSTFHYSRSPKSRIQEFQGSTNIQKLYYWRQ